FIAWLNSSLPRRYQPRIPPHRLDGVEPELDRLAVLVERDRLDIARSALEPHAAGGFTAGPAAHAGLHEVKGGSVVTQADAKQLRAGRLVHTVVLHVQRRATVEHWLSSYTPRSP